MVRRSFEHVLSKIKEDTTVVIVGAGKAGKELFTLLQNQQISIFEIFDNNSNEDLLNGVRIVRPYKVSKGNCVYIITMADIKIRHSVKAQLLSLGIDESEIVVYHNWRDYEYVKNLDEKYYKEEISEVYREKFGRELNWDNPQTYNEKLNCDKLKDRNKLKTILADKFLVKEWVAKQIGEEYVTKLYGVWNKASDIDFAILPDKFVLKTNNGSGRNIIVQDKSVLNRGAVCEQLDEWLQMNFAYTDEFQLHYKDIEPKIICEEYLEGVAEEVYDYNIYCFHGEPEYIWCIKGSHRPGCQATFYDKDWNAQEFYFGNYLLDPIKAPRPNKLDEMIQLSRVLSKEFKHVRVDWYNMPDGRLLFGEMTFTSWGGIHQFFPPKYDEILGKLI